MSRETEALQEECLQAAKAVWERAPAPDVMPLSALRDCSGLELFRRMMRGELPGFGRSYCT